MTFLSFIESKRDGKALRGGQIQYIISEYAAGRIPDYQMSAMLMAILFRGMTTEETLAMTLAMRDSGTILRFPKDERPLVDKHSTGGVGDKISLPLAPLLACMGFRVPMISGRGLGITGGTLDKLDSIPGFSPDRTVEQIQEQVQTVGCIICGQTESMVPADKKLYALRDVTGTVPSIPLIVASIMSKKLAESLHALVLDVKFGSAAFMQTKDQARDLAKAMVALGKECGVSTRALLTDMNTPLGRAAGNWLEVKESVECLDQGFGQSNAADVMELVVGFASQLFRPETNPENFAEGVKTAWKCLESRAPRKKWDEMIVAQGADLDTFNRKLALDHTAPVVKELKARATRFVKSCDARVVGEIVRDLGGGRIFKDSVINHDVGIDHLAKPGELLKAGDLLARVHATSEKDAVAARLRLESAFAFCDDPPWTDILVQETIA